MKHIEFKSLSVIFCLTLAGQAQAASHTVIMKSISYDPKIIEVKVGDSVEWSNKSYTDHSATADDGKSFDTDMVAPHKSSKKIEFKTVGTFPYHCSLHGHSMSGQVIVSGGK